MKLLVEKVGEKGYEKESPFIHTHKYCEIITYFNGNGTLFVNGEKYPVESGCIAVIPSGNSHGSISHNNLNSIYIAGDFGYDFTFTHPIIIKDTPEKEGTCLVNIIYNNRYGDKEYLYSLCNAYVNFIIKNLNFEDDITQAVGDIARNIEKNFHDYNIKLNDYLLKSGYAEDYVRAHFKRVMGKTPNEYLTEIRIKHALKLIDVYANTMQLFEIAERCGYNDYIYFSRKFKQVLGVSPQTYKRELKITDKK